MHAYAVCNELKKNMNEIHKFEYLIYVAVMNSVKLCKYKYAVSLSPSLINSGKTISLTSFPLMLINDITFSVNNYLNYLQLGCYSLQLQAFDFR